MLSLMERALANVKRLAAQLVATERAFGAAVREAHRKGASVRVIEAAAREVVGRSQRGFTRERTG